MPQWFYFFMVATGILGIFLGLYMTFTLSAEQISRMVMAPGVNFPAFAFFAGLVIAILGMGLALTDRHH